MGHGDSQPKPSSLDINLEATEGDLEVVSKYCGCFQIPNGVSHRKLRSCSVEQGHGERPPFLVCPKAGTATECFPSESLFGTA